MIGSVRSRPVVAPPVVVLFGVAWALAVLTYVSGTAEALHHHDIAHGGLWAGLALFLVAWPVHVAAMMLPSSLPMVANFDRVAAGQPRYALIRGAFLSGYLAVWTLFGVVALAADLALHRLVERSPWLAGRPGVITGAVLAGAGLFQFSALKDRCLRECRHPGAFIVRHYRRGAGGATSLGVRHGLFCLGCCWALMLVMFAVGIANLPVMAILALVMIYEKTGRWGHAAGRWVGSALVLLGIVMLARPSAVPTFLIGG